MGAKSSPGDEPRVLILEFPEHATRGNISSLKCIRPCFIEPEVSWSLHVPEVLLPSSSSGAGAKDAGKFTVRTEEVGSTNKEQMTNSSERWGNYQRWLVFSLAVNLKWNNGSFWILCSLSTEPWGALVFSLRLAWPGLRIMTICLPWTIWAPETQVWADLRAIHIFQIPEIIRLGIWLMRCTASTMSFPAATPRRIQNSGPVHSPTEVRALQGADGLGRLTQRGTYTTVLPWSPPRSPGEPVSASLLVSRRALW